MAAPAPGTLPPRLSAACAPCGRAGRRRAGSPPPPRSLLRRRRASPGARLPARSSAPPPLLLLVPEPERPEAPPPGRGAGPAEHGAPPPEPRRPLQAPRLLEPRLGEGGAPPGGPAEPAAPPEPRGPPRAPGGLERPGGGELPGGPAAPALADWVVAELAALLWTQELAALARCSAASRGAAGAHWRRCLAARGFATGAAARLRAADAAALERWGGQGWDVWHRPSIEDDCTVLRHWRHGTVLLLTSGSNGWFEYQVSSGSSPQIFYSNGSSEDLDASGSFLAANPDMIRTLAEVPGANPLLRLPEDRWSSWRWAFDGEALFISNGHPGELVAQRRICLSATGFYAYSDSRCSAYGPSLVVEDGVCLRAGARRAGPRLG